MLKDQNLMDKELTSYLDEFYIETLSTEDLFHIPGYCFKTSLREMGCLQFPNGIFLVSHITGNKVLFERDRVDTELQIMIYKLEAPYHLKHPQLINYKLLVYQK